MLYHRLIDGLVLGPNLRQPSFQVLDVGAYPHLAVNVQVLKTGSGTLRLQHAAVNEDDAFLNLPNVLWALGGLGSFVAINGFLRYVRWATDGDVASSPVAVMDIIGKAPSTSSGSAYHRLLDARTLKPATAQPTAEVFDAGDYRALEVNTRMLKAGSGTAGLLKLQHAPVNEPDAFRDLASAQWPTGTNSSSNSYLQVTGFCRYIRWLADVNANGDPIGRIDLVAKD